MWDLPTTLVADPTGVLLAIRALHGRARASIELVSATGPVLEDTVEAVDEVISQIFGIRQRLDPLVLEGDAPRSGDGPGANHLSCRSTGIVLRDRPFGDHQDDSTLVDVAVETLDLTRRIKSVIEHEDCAIMQRFVFLKLQCTPLCLGWVWYYRLIF